MSRAWSAKDERQYQHIKESTLQRGESQDRAEEIAARTVNKERREEGRTSNRCSMGTGNPNVDLSQRSRDELVNEAKSRGIRGRSHMTKNELVSAIRGSG